MYYLFHLSLSCKTGCISRNQKSGRCLQYRTTAMSCSCTAVCVAVLRSPKRCHVPQESKRGRSKCRCTQVPCTSALAPHEAINSQHNHDLQGLPVPQFLVPWLSKVKVRELSSWARALFPWPLLPHGSHMAVFRHLTNTNGAGGTASLLPVRFDSKSTAGRHGSCCPVRGAGRMHALRCHRCTS